MPLQLSNSHSSLDKFHSLITIESNGVCICSAFIVYCSFEMRLVYKVPPSGEKL